MASETSLERKFSSKGFFDLDGVWSLLLLLFIKSCVAVASVVVDVNAMDGAFMFILVEQTAVLTTSMGANADTIVLLLLPPNNKTDNANRVKKDDRDEDETVFMVLSMRMALHSKRVKGDCKRVQVSTKPIPQTLDSLDTGWGTKQQRRSTTRREG